MQKYLGMRGQALNAAQIYMLIMPAYLLFGFNNAVAGGVDSEASFVKTFPRINTATTKGAQETNNSRVLVSFETFERLARVVFTDSFKGHGRRIIHAWRLFRISFMYLDWKSIG